MSQKDDRLVSIIMPVYNAEEYVAEAIESILNQTYKNIELLVIDDASTDASNKVIQSFSDPRIRYFHNEKNLGYLKSVNKMFKECLGDFIAFQDADDVCSLERLKLQINALNSDFELKFCGTQCIYSKNGKEERRSNFPFFHGQVVSQLEQGDTTVLCGASVVIKREILSDGKVFRGFFDRIGAEHLDFFWQLMLKNKYKNLSEYLYSYRSTSNSFSKELNLNPLKYHSTQIALLAYWQKKISGEDALDKTETKLGLEKSIKSQYLNDSSLIYRQAGFMQLAFGEYRLYFSCLMKAISLKGMTLANIKMMVIWLPLFIFMFITPRKFQRKVVMRNNLKFLKEQGVDVSKKVDSVNDS